MLAAAYAVAMRLHSQPGHNSFRQTELPYFAKSIYWMVFAPGARFRTTHALTREYARGILECAQRYHPTLLHFAPRTNDGRIKFPSSPFEWRQYEFPPTLTNSSTITSSGWIGAITLSDTSFPPEVAMTSRTPITKRFVGGSCGACAILDMILFVSQALTRKSHTFIGAARINRAGQIATGRSTHGSLILSSTGFYMTGDLLGDAGQSTIHAGQWILTLTLRSREPNGLD